MRNSEEKMRVIIGHEFSGTIRRAFQECGHEAYSCDLRPATDGSKDHFQGDIFDVIEQKGPFDIGIFHPECTYLCNSGIHWNGRVAGRADKTKIAIEHVKKVWALPIKKIAIENPNGVLSTRWKKPSQIIQPWQFGENASKATCLWLRNLLPLRHTKIHEPRYVAETEGGG